MIQETSFNSTSNEMPFAYLRTKRLVSFLRREIPKPAISIPVFPDELCNCCDFDKNFILLALADVNDNSTFKNDYLPILYEVPLEGNTLQFTLQKHNGVSFADVMVLDNTYGTDYPSGTWSDFPLFVGYRLNWRTVLINHGTGFYRVKIQGTGLGGAITEYTALYCLKNYSIHSANQTVKFEWNNNGIITSADDEFTYTDFGNINWQEMIRLKGAFGFPIDEQEVVDISFFSGNALEVERIRDKTNYKYKFKSGYYPDWIHSILKNVSFKSNSLYVTTYGKLDKHDYVRKRIVKESNGYQPNYENVYKKDYKVEVDFRDKYDDLGFRKNCAPSGRNCEPVTIYNELGEVIDVIPSGGQYVDDTSTVGGSVNVSNSDDTYDVNVPCGSSHELPDTTVNVYIDGSLITTESIVTLGNDNINIYL